MLYSKEIIISREERFWNSGQEKKYNRDETLTLIGLLLPWGVTITTSWSPIPKAMGFKG